MLIPLQMWWMISSCILKNQGQWNSDICCFNTFEGTNFFWGGGGLDWNIQTVTVSWLACSVTIACKKNQQPCSSIANGWRLRPVTYFHAAKDESFSGRLYPFNLLNIWRDYHFPPKHVWTCAHQNGIMFFGEQKKNKCPGDTSFNPRFYSDKSISRTLAGFWQPTNC